MDIEKLKQTAQYHIKRGDSMQMDPKVILELCGQSAVAVNAQLLEALKELMYARTDKAEGMAEAAIAAAEAEKARGQG